MSKKISIIGSGRWGSLLAWYHDFIGCDVTLYGQAESTTFQTLKATRKNDYLTLSEKIHFTSNLQDVLKNEIIFISIPAQKLRELCGEIKKLSYSNKTFVLCMKGLETETGRRLSEVMQEELGTVNIAVLVGPGHAQSLTKKIPTCMLVDGNSTEIKQKIIETSSSSLIRLYEGNDLIGSEIGAATKNIIGLAAGMLDGFEYKELKGALMARGAYEVGSLIEAAGGNRMSAYGLAHLGDYEATLFSKYSHNRLYGEKFVKQEEITKRAEGVETLKATLTLAGRHHCEMPICEALVQVLFGKGDPKEILSALFSRPVKKEF